MDISLLEKLVPLLDAAHVKYFKEGDLEIEFFGRGLPALPKAAPPEPPSGPVAPADLGADDTMNYDQILFHSASQGPEAEGLPLTGDAPLDGGEP